MSSPLTENRRKKSRLLREAYDVLLDLMLMKDIDRDKANMSLYKEMLRKVKGMKIIVKNGRCDTEKYTKNSENRPATHMTQQGDIEER